MIKKFFKGLQKFTREVTLSNQDDYVVIRVPDPANVALVECHFARAEVHNFQFEGDITLNLEYFNKVVKSDDFVITKKDGQIIVKDGTRTGTLKEIEPEAPCQFKFDFTNGTELKVSDLLKLQGDSVLFKGLGDQLSISESNDLYSVEEMIDGAFPHDKTKISGEYLKLIKDLFVFGDYCEIRFETDRPLCVFQQFGNSKLGYMIAPRVDNG